MDLNYISLLHMNKLWIHFYFSSCVFFFFYSFPYIYNPSALRKEHHEVVYHEHSWLFLMMN